MGYKLFGYFFFFFFRILLSKQRFSYFIFSKPDLVQIIISKLEKIPDFQFMISHSLFHSSIQEFTF